MADQYNWSGAAEYLSGIDYMDSKELAARYSQMTENRLIDGRFYYVPEELAMLMTGMLADYNTAYTAKLMVVSGDSGCISLYNNGAESQINLLMEGIDSDGKSFTKMTLLQNDVNQDVDLYTLSMLLVAQLADPTLDEAAGLELIDGLLYENTKVRNQVEYMVAYTDQEMILSAYPAGQAEEGSQGLAAGVNEKGHPSCTLFVERYNEAVDFFNAVMAADGSSAALNQITAADIMIEGKLIPNGAGTLFLNPNMDNWDYIFNTNYMLEDISSADTLVAAGEIFAFVYALDPLMGTDECFDIVNEFSGDAGSSSAYNGITYHNYSFDGMLMYVVGYDNE